LKKPERIIANHQNAIKILSQQAFSPSSSKQALYSQNTRQDSNRDDRYEFPIQVGNQRGASLQPMKQHSRVQLGGKKNAPESKTSKIEKFSKISGKKSPRAMKSSEKK